MIELTEQQEALLKQIVDSFRHGVGGEECPECKGTGKGMHRRLDPAPTCKTCGGSGKSESWEEHVRKRELRVLGLLAAKHGYHLLKIDPELTFKDDDA